VLSAVRARESDEAGARSWMGSVGDVRV